ncbi:2-oxoglutarate carboxylase small subunit [Sedimentisphaera cyanobacteriorum]|uniref:biotin carboxylase n=1 Tax=Sedimentisphaera cyanobacteriorum TaxID=1940790 RepID=A0A1Q2HQC2_9BACT|nr:hypothetical protein [Sedimentisphaera cyanobacteriorum]AQQ09456.1 2-oxoglutarate carboxylase small subunit [Sedimentisphaera cyanobacteriorum]
MPGGFGVRVETFLKQGDFISPNYDSMIAKLLVHQPDRETALATMKRALQEFRIAPIKTTIPASLQIIDHPSYRNNQIDTGFLESEMEF